ncbi:hypothetical protein B0H16DRAFT_720515 [Mycena metata]|uniref:Large ribosomal subunit protein eL42 n=1 Tax=Mycena metata TaxID=1033252 RepID=A0AAD7GRS6_9AGAR|nr:hypothetical protein B0H16DRAFT_993609 [Mycena metata]KAJ7703847.1 hypothetical protein B0H16DRAFT_720515 [Mycena metata]
MISSICMAFKVLKVNPPSNGTNGGELLSPTIIWLDRGRCRVVWMDGASMLALVGVTTSPALSPIHIHIPGRFDPPPSRRSHKVTQYKPGKALLFAQGKCRYDRKQSGYGGQTKLVFHKKVYLHPQLYQSLVLRYGYCATGIARALSLLPSRRACDYPTVAEACDHEYRM